MGCKKSGQKIKGKKGFQRQSKEGSQKIELHPKKRKVKGIKGQRQTKGTNLKQRQER